MATNQSVHSKDSSLALSQIPTHVVERQPNAPALRGGILAGTIMVDGSPRSVTVYLLDRNNNIIEANEDRLDGALKERICNLASNSINYFGEHMKSERATPHSLSRDTYGEPRLWSYSGVDLGGNYHLEDVELEQDYTDNGKTEWEEIEYLILGLYNSNVGIHSMMLHIGSPNQRTDLGMQTDRDEEFEVSVELGTDHIVSEGDKLLEVTPDRRGIQSPRKEKKDPPRKVVPVPTFQLTALEEDDRVDSRDVDASLLFDGERDGNSVTAFRKPSRRRSSVSVIGDPGPAQRRESGPPMGNSNHLSISPIQFEPGHQRRGSSVRDFPDVDESRNNNTIYSRVGKSMERRLQEEQSLLQHGNQTLRHQKRSTLMPKLVKVDPVEAQHRELLGMNLDARESRQSVIDYIRLRDRTTDPASATIEAEIKRLKLEQQSARR